MARTWVFPILRIIIFLAIAAALVKLAFFGGDTQGSDPTVPTGAITEPEVAVSVGTITNDVELDGTVNLDAPVVVKATLTGEIRELLVKPGDAVAADTPVLRIRSQVPSDAPSEDPTAPAVKTTWSTVVAGAAGAISLPALVGQQVSVGDEVAKVVRSTFNVSATMAPEQQYRLLNRPTDALIAIAGGPAPFTCGALAIGTSAADAETGATTTVTCAVPAEVTVFAGLSARMTISGGAAEGALVVPVTAVEGTSGAGKVYLPSSGGGDPAPKDVVLGINDGESVQVLEGLAEGDSILMFIPNAPEPAGAGGPMPGVGG